MTAIFPSLSIVTFGHNIVVTTNVRKKDKDGVYRLIYLQEHLLCGENDKDEILMAAVNNINRRAYKAYREEDVDDSVYETGAAKDAHKYPKCNSCDRNGKQQSNFERYRIEVPRKSPDPLPSIH